MKKHLMAIAVLTCVAAFPVEAGDFYVGAGAGKTSAELSASSAIQFDATGYQAFVGYHVMRSFAVELGYTDFGDLDATQGTQQYRADASNVALWGIGILPATPRLALYGRLGWAAYDSEVTVSDGMTTPATTTSDGSDLAWGFGISYYFTRSFGLRFDWTKFGFEQSDEVTFTSVDAMFKF